MKLVQMQKNHGKINFFKDIEMKTRLFMTLIGIFFVSSSNATSGRTDASGCHNSKKIGFHCHGGSSFYSPSVKKLKKSVNHKAQNTTNYPANASSYDKEKSLIQGIQVQLNYLGYEVGKVDGILGSRTIFAIKSFQKSNNIFVDGKPSTDLLINLILANVEED